MQSCKKFKGKGNSINLKSMDFEDVCARANSLGFCSSVAILFLARLLIGNDENETFMRHLADKLVKIRDLLETVRNERKENHKARAASIGKREHFSGKASSVISARERP
jgi:nitrogenase molybdenum-iron protein alpha/beta subunit